MRDCRGKGKGNGAGGWGVGFTSLLKRDSARFAFTISLYYSAQAMPDRGKLCGLVNLNRLAHLKVFTATPPDWLKV